MPDLHMSTGAYALDALEDIEHRAFERHLRDCPDCVIEVRDFHEATAMLADRTATEPPASLRPAVLEAIARTRQLPPATRPRLPRFTWRSTLMAAAAVLIAASAGIGGVAWESQRGGQTAQIEAGQIVQGRPSVGGNAAVVVTNGKAVFAADQLPPAPQGRTYQLWVISGKVIRSAGLLTLKDGTGHALIPDVPSGASVAMSVEPDGGSQQPTTQPVLNLQVA